VNLPPDAAPGALPGYQFWSADKEQAYGRDRKGKRVQQQRNGSRQELHEHARQVRPRNPSGRRASEQLCIRVGDVLPSDESRQVG
jgi:hypothetical protein